MASVNDLFRKGAPAFATTLASQKNAGAASMSLAGATGVPTDTGLDFTVGRVDSSGTATPSLKAVYKGTLSGTTVSNLTLVEGTDQTHAAGTPVEITFTAETWNDAVDGILADHSQSGGHEVATNYDPSNPTLETQKWAGVASAVNEITVTNAATGNYPTISATGEADTGIDFENSEGEEILKLDAIASAVNEVTIANAATGNGPEIQATGGDTNINVEVIPKGTGKLTVGGNPISHGAWESWTPTLSGRFEDAKFNKTGKYIQIGKTIHARLKLVANTTSPMDNGGGSDAIITLPVAALTGSGAGDQNAAIGSCAIYDSGTALYAGHVSLLSSDVSKAVIRNLAVSGSLISAAAMSESSPMTWTTNDECFISITYEAA